MHQITIRGFDQELEQQLRELARQQDLSLNKAAILLMRKGAGLRTGQRGPELIGPALDQFIGSWSAADADAVQRAVEDFEHIDPSFWA